MGKSAQDSPSVSVEGPPIRSPKSTSSALPTGTDRGNRRQALAARRASLRVDVASFAAESYRPEVYLRTTMEADTEEAVQSSLRSLTAACEKSVAELRKAVFKNHIEFLEVTKGIMDFEGGLGVLRGLQSDLRSSANALINSAGVSDYISLEETRDNIQESMITPSDHEPSKKEQFVTPIGRISNEEQIARQQKMTTLAESISDFDKYLTDDRYLIFEGGGINEISGSAAKPVTLYLFNDSIAIISKKGRMATGGGTVKKFSLEHFWPLHEITIEDVPDSKDFTNAIRLDNGNGHVILQTDNITGKRLWLQQITKTQRTIIHSPSIPSIKSPQSQPQTPTSRPRSSQIMTTVKDTMTHRRRPSTLSSKKTEISTIIDIPPEKHSQMLSYLDELNGETDKCNYDAAVEMVDKIKYELAQMDPRSPSLHPLNQRLQIQVGKLANYLYHEISDLIIGKDEMSKHIQRLVVLGFPDEAREKFLAARSDFIKERTKHLRYIGDITKTVNDIGFATFSSISASADWYIGSFKDHTMTAGFVFWAKLEINNYVNMIAKQVFIGDTDFRLIGDCIAIARRQCSSLKSIGLDFLFYLDDQLIPHINNVLDRYQQKCEVKIKKTLDQDDFLEDKLEVTRKETEFDGITISAVCFYKTIIEMLNDIEPLLLSETSEVIISHLVSLFENYSTALLQISYSDLPSTAYLNLIANFNFITDEFLPSLTSQLESRFNRTFGDLARLYARLQATIKALYELFTKKTANHMVPQDPPYSTEGPIDPSMDISDWLITMLALYAKISRDAKERRESLMTTLLFAILAEMESSLERVKLGSNGIQRFLLDVHFLILVSTPFLNQEVSEKASDTCKAALNAFKGDSKTLKPDSWYDQRAKELTSRHKPDFGI